MLHGSTYELHMAALVREAALRYFYQALMFYVSQLALIGGIGDSGGGDLTAASEVELGFVAPG